jgi:hypothetical protein
MSTRLCRPLFKVLNTQVAKVKIPAGSTFYPGQVVMAETLLTTLTNNLEVYSPTPVSDVTTDYPCILINQGYETLPDGRRPVGNSNIGTYTWANENTLTAIRLEKGMKFFISDDCLDNAGVVVPAVGVYFIPQVGDYDLATSASVGTCVTALIVETTHDEGIGGQNSFQFTSGSVARVKLGL